MKKLLILIVVSIVVLTGCKATKVVYELTYIESIKTSKGEILQFKDKYGYKLTYFVDPIKSFNLETGKIYDVTVTVQEIMQNGDFITEAKSR